MIKSWSFNDSNEKMYDVLFFVGAKGFDDFLNLMGYIEGYISGLSQ